MPDLIDINCGCPVKKVVKKNGGAALLKDLKLLEKILKSVVRAAQFPVTLKIRSGWDQDNLVAVRVAKMAEDCGISAITIHPRTQKDGFTKKADWNIIPLVKQELCIPVIGSGDLFTPQDVRNMLDGTGCDAVMIARGSFGNPWIFSRTNHLLQTGELLPEPGVEERIQTCLQHADLSVKEYGESVGVKRMRKHLVWYTRGMVGVKELRQKLFTLENLDQVRRVFHEYLEETKRKHPS